MLSEEDRIKEFVKDKGLTIGFFLLPLKALKAFKD